MIRVKYESVGVTRMCSNNHKVISIFEENQHSPFIRDERSHT